MSPLQQRAMEPTKAAFGKAFWDQEAESAAALMEEEIVKDMVVVGCVFGAKRCGGTIC